MEKTSLDKLNLLWQGASYQDHLLQSYRSFHLTLQSILIAIGAGLAVVILSFEDLFNASLAALILIAISYLGFFLLRKMKNVVKARGEDVDYYHNLIIENEREASKDLQVMTSFKVYQYFKRINPDALEYFEESNISEEIRSKLIEKGSGHTRKVLDRDLFIRFKYIWLAFYLITFIKLSFIIYKLYSL